MENLPENTVVERKPQKSLLIGNLVKIVIFALIGAAAVGGTFYLENNRGEAVQPGVQASERGQLNLSGENIIADEALLRFNTGDNKAVIKNFDQGALVNVEKGELWLNSVHSDMNLNFWFSDKLVLIPNRAAFSASFDGDKLELQVFDGDVLVALWDKDQPTELVDFYSEKFMNTVLVPRETQVRITTSKISEQLRPLLPAKLRKEFKYTAIPAKTRDSEWVQTSEKGDMRWIGAKKQAVRSEIINKGLSVTSGVLNSTMDWLSEKLTFVPEKRDQLLLSNLFENVDNALFYAQDGEMDQMQNSLYAFDTALYALPSDLLAGPMYDDLMKGYLDRLSVFALGDNEHEVLAFLLSKGLNDPFKLADFYWANVYAGVDQGRLEASQAFDQYFEVYVSKIPTDDVRYGQYVIYLNQLFDNLFLRYSTFYLDGYFAQKHDLEAVLMNVYRDDANREELVQSFIQTKIDFLKRLRRYFFDGDVDVQEAKKIFRRLMEESRGLLPEKEQSSVAVIELFQKQLNDINDFWGYLNSPEYQAKHYGKTHEERYKVYLEERDKLSGFSNLQQEVFGEVVTEEKSIEEVQNEVLAFFDAQDGVGGVEIGEIGDAAQRYVKVNIVLAGYPLEAIFDRDTELLQEIYVYDELLTERPVNVPGLLALLQDTFADIADNGGNGEGEDISIESVAQRTARLYVAQLVEDFGFAVSIDDVSVFDSAAAIYRVEKIHLLDDEKVTVTFDLLMTKEVATHVFMTVDGEPIVVDGEFKLDELVALIDAKENPKKGITRLPATDPGDESASGANDVGL